MRARDGVENSNSKFVHYTSAEVAFNILKGRTVWMRNSITMNDFSEVQHGLNCLGFAYRSEYGTRFKSAFNKIFPGFTDSVETMFVGWEQQFRQETYLTCMSEHDSSEDTLGRLSMWRAYGGANGVAVVLNNTPFINANDDLKAYSSPVAYRTLETFLNDFKEITENVEANIDYLSELPYNTVLGVVFTMMRFACLCTKHLGFQEEREWRIVYSPTFEKSAYIERDFAVVRGIPQLIYKLPLKNDPSAGLVNADIPSLVNRVIIGPSQQPFTLYQAFVNLLTEVGVTDAVSKVFVSEIPLRSL